MKRIDLKKLPEAWHQLTLDQIYAVSKLFIRNNGAKDFVVRFFMVITGWKLLRKKEVTEFGKSWYWFSAKGKAKQWYSKTFFAEIEKLKIIMAEKYGIKAQMSIINTIEETTI